MKNENLSSEVQMYITEYQELSNNMRSFWKVRLTILGFIITLIGILIKQFDSTVLIKVLILETTLLLIIFGATVILITLTKHLIIYGIRLAEIEKKIIKDGFWKKWGKFVRKHSGYSNTKAISITMHLINIVLIIYIIWKNLNYFVEYDGIGVLFTILLVLFGIFNLLFIQFRLNPGKHWNKVKLDWEEA